MSLWQPTQPLSCPSCSCLMEHCPRIGDHACPNCGLAGPADILRILGDELCRLRTLAERYNAEQLADELTGERQSGLWNMRPARVMAEAERLLRARGVWEVTLYHDGQWNGMRQQVLLCVRPEIGRDANGETLAQAYSMLTGEVQRC